MLHQDDKRSQTGQSRAATRLRRPGPVNEIPELLEVDQAQPPATSGAQRARSPRNFGAPLKKGRKAPRSRRTTTITIVGDFPNPWKKIQTEIARIEAGRWSPTVDDFEAVSGSRKPVQCSSFLSFLGLLSQKRIGSVGRINIITHASKTCIAFEGTVEARTGITTLDTSTGLTAESLARIQNIPWFRPVGSRKRFTVPQALQRLAKGAQLYLYACNTAGGDNLRLLQMLADTFQMTVLGFTKYLKYEPSFTTNPPSINRKAVKKAGSADPAVATVLELTPDAKKTPTR